MEAWCPVGEASVRARLELAELQGYQYKIKILGQGGDFRIHGKVSGGRIIFDKVTTH